MYFVLEIATYVDGSPTSKGVYEYATLDQAVSTFHSKLAGAMKNENYATELVMVISKVGSVMRHEYYVRGANDEPAQA